eukprot:NODE_1704_length_1635_cov_82.102513_g1624_i0.p1 GENE.NODE_1704_length_1635_cov_82.102513_g1624_i0~~NODE_1704_length_1635_cov_82.102513_g1624_i0.p1  ORF type:complete len:543 (+),score=154.13 NODE_1704_length_1635_cov_82.102513_g1624_i0:64-1629(+)
MSDLKIFIGNLPQGTQPKEVEDFCVANKLPLNPKKEGRVEVVGSKACVVLETNAAVKDAVRLSDKATIGKNVITVRNVELAKGVVTKIRASWGIGVDVDAKVKEILTKYRSSLSESLRLLSEELYSTSTHFFLELIQNADDNVYGPGVTPTFKIRLDPNPTAPMLHVINNEVGFQEKHVVAVCDSGQSTKAKKDGFIGEKGIGFKSVFAVSSSPMIVSYEYSWQFRLTTADPMGYVVPHWVEESEIPEGTQQMATNILLPLKPKLIKTVQDTLRAVSHVILLFLKNIRVMQIVTSKDKAYGMARRDLGDNIIEITRSTGPSLTQLKSGGEDSVKRYKMVEKELKLTPGMARDRGTATNSYTRITLGFPIGKIEKQHVFAFLPVREFGFKFLIQADFKLSTTRGDIPESEWNNWLRDNIPDIFESAIKMFQTSEHFRTSFLELVPLLEEVPTESFHPLVKSIHAKLQKTACILTEGDKWLRPDQVFFPPQPDMAKLIRNSDLASTRDMEFLSRDINLSRTLR